MAFSKSSITRWAWSLLIVSSVAASFFILTFPTAKDPVKGCLGALTISGLAGCIALLPVFYAVSYKPDLTQILSLAAGGIRLLLTIAGIVIICLLVDVNVLWLIGWTAFFYLVVLAAEIRLVILAVNLNKITGVTRT